MSDVAHLKKTCANSLADTTDLASISADRCHFERMASIAQRVLNVPIVAILLVNDNRPILLAGRGVDQGEVTANAAFFDAVAQTEGDFVTSDTTSAAPTSTLGGGQLRFWAACPLADATGRRTGLLCVLDWQPRPISESDIQNLHDLAALAEGCLATSELKDTLIRLRSGEDRYQSLISAVAEAVIIRDQTGRVVEANANAERLLQLVPAADGIGYQDPAESAIHEDGSLYPPNQVPGLRTLQTGRPVANEVVGIPHPPEGTTWLVINTQPLFHPGEPTPYAVVASLTDVTTFRQTQEELRFQKELLEYQSEASIEGVIIISVDLRVLFTNRQFLGLWNLSRDLVGTILDESHAQRLLDKVIDQPAFLEKLVNLYENPNATTRSEIMLRDGRILDWHSAPIRVPGAVAPGRVWFFRDVTTSRRTEEALRNVTSHVHCILWDGFVESRDGELVWNVRVLDEETAQRVLPLARAPGQTYVEAWRESIRSEDQERRNRLIAGMSYGTSTMSDEFACRGTDGRLYWLAESLNVETLRPGLWRLFGVSTDITRLKNDEEELGRLSRQYELILKAAGDGITGIDVAGRTTFLNPAAARMLGRGLTDLHGQIQHDAIHHTRSDGRPYPVDQCPIYAALHDGEVYHVSNEVFWRKDGTSFPVEYTCTPIREDEKIVGAVMSFRDVTEQRKVDRMKDEFISVVSHELRTPLTSIRGSLGLLASGVLGPLPESGRRMLEIAVNNTDRLVRLINDILDIERIESGKVSMDKRICDAGDLIQQAVEVVQPIAAKSNIEITVSTDSVQLRADPDRLVQVMTNVLSNAVKFSSSGSKVALSARRQGSELLIRVKDEGRGIPPDKLETIFGRFQQVDASDSRERGGTGLGLAISRSIVLQHGGRIWVESTLGVGSTFTIALPALAEEPAAPLPRPMLQPTALTDAGVSNAVLICDDDPSTLEVLGTMLTNRGYRVILTNSGSAAIREAAKQKPGVILLDLVMPNMNGWETIAALKREPETEEIPVIIFSALSPTDEAARAGVVDWLVKPLEEIPLLDTLERVLNSSGRPPRVLIVEDDVDLARVITAMFQRDGIETIHAQTSQEAIQLSQESDPDLLVLDLILPNGDGFSVVDWLRQHNRLRSMPVVVYSARDLDASDRDRLRLGYTRFLTKGRVRPEQFEEQVIGLLRQVMPIRVGVGG